MHATNGSGTSAAPRQPDRLRNVVLLGAAGAGKTTLLEALLVAAGARQVAGDVQDGTTTCDSDPAARALGRTVQLAVASLEHRGVTVNLVDVPGSPDHLGALRAGTAAADAVLLVVSAAGGLDAVTAQRWAECEAAGVPRLVVVTQLDRARADFDEAVALCQRLLSDAVLPAHLPMHDDDGTVAGLISLLDQRLADHSSGARVVRPAESEHLGLVADLRAELVEAVLAESDDGALLDDYLDGQEPPLPVLAGELHAATRRGHLHPVLACAPLAGVGLAELLDLLVDALPSPLDVPPREVTEPDGSPTAPLEGDPAGPLAAQVVRTEVQPDGSRLCWVRVHSGTLLPGAEVVVVPVVGHGGQATVASLSRPLGDARTPVPGSAAGDIAVVGLAVAAGPGSTLHGPAVPLTVQRWALPEPQHTVALDVAALGPSRPAAAGRVLVEQDPTVRFEQAGGQQLLRSLGPDHEQAVLHQLQELLGQPVTTVAPAAAPLRTVDGVLLEPWSEVVVQVPSAFASAVLSDLRGRRARSAAREADERDDDLSLVRAELPDAELAGYPLALRAVAYGTASFTRRPLGDEPVPAP